MTEERIVTQRIYYDDPYAKEFDAQIVSVEPDSASALSDALVAACRGDEKQFSSFLAGENPAAFQALHAALRT